MLHGGDPAGGRPRGDRFVNLKPPRPLQTNRERPHCISHRWLHRTWTIRRRPSLIPRPQRHPGFAGRSQAGPQASHSPHVEHDAREGDQAPGHHLNAHPAFGPHRHPPRGVGVAAGRRRGPSGLSDERDETWPVHQPVSFPGDTGTARWRWRTPRTGPQHDYRTCAKPTRRIPANRQGSNHAGNTIPVAS